MLLIPTTPNFPIPTPILCIPTLIPRIPIISTLIFRISIIPTLISHTLIIPTLIPRILIIPLISFPDSLFRLLPIALF